MSDVDPTRASTERSRECVALCGPTTRTQSPIIVNTRRNLLFSQRLSSEMIGQPLASLPRHAPVLRVLPGSPYPLGSTWDGKGVNFAIFSEVRPILLRLIFRGG